MPPSEKEEISALNSSINRLLEVCPKLKDRMQSASVIQDWYEYGSGFQSISEELLKIKPFARIAMLPEECSIEGSKYDAMVEFFIKSNISKTLGISFKEYLDLTPVETYLIDKACEEQLRRETEMADNAQNKLQQELNKIKNT